MNLCTRCTLPTISNGRASRRSRGVYPSSPATFTLARAFIQALDDPDTVVPSPSFTLVQPYDTLKGALLHVDLYRITQPDEVYELGLTDHQADHQKGDQTEPTKTLPLGRCTFNLAMTITLMEAPKDA